MPNHNLIKNSLEGFTAKKFLDLYNNAKTTEISFIRFGDANKKEPDIICTNNFSIEITTSYDNESQTKKIWNDARGIPNLILSQASKLNTKENIELAVFNKLRNLENGLYAGVLSSSSKIILLCYCVSKLFNSSDAQRIKTIYMPFKDDLFFKGYFYETWLYWWESGDDYRILFLE